MNPLTLLAFHSHARAEFPRECCGLVLIVRGRERYFRCRNISGSPEQFILHPEDWAAAEDLGEILAVCHSHPNMPAIPSEADLAACEASGKEWHIVNVHAEGDTIQAGAPYSFRPSGYVAPLLGLPWVHGIHDCYSLVQRYYRQELDIALPDYARAERWWDQGQNLYLENFEQAGFVQVERARMRPHDVLFMQVGAQVPNHAAVYCGDNHIVQHLMGRLSSRDVYGGWWRQITTHAVRHRSLL